MPFQLRFFSVACAAQRPLSPHKVNCLYGKTSSYVPSKTVGSGMALLQEVLLHMSFFHPGGVAFITYAFCIADRAWDFGISGTSTALSFCYILLALTVIRPSIEGLVTKQLVADSKSQICCLIRQNVHLCVTHGVFQVDLHSVCFSRPKGWRHPGSAAVRA